MTKDEFYDKFMKGIENLRSNGVEILKHKIEGDKHTIFVKGGRYYKLAFELNDTAFECSSTKIALAHQDDAQTRVNNYLTSLYSIKTANKMLSGGGTYWKTILKADWEKENGTFKEKKAPTDECPKCGRLFSNLKAHIDKCPTDASPEGIMKNWKLKAVLLPMGEISNPGTEFIGVSIHGKRKVNKGPVVGCRIIIFGDHVSEVYTYAKSQRETYQKEVDEIVAHWGDYAKAVPPDTSNERFKENPHTCHVCGAIEVPGVYNDGGYNGSSFCICVGCMIEMVARWCMGLGSRTQ